MSVPTILRILDLGQVFLERMGAYFHPMNTAERKLEFIREHALAGRTVYLSTALRHIAIKAKHLSLVRVRGDTLEVMQGKQGWVNANYCQLSAR